MDFFIEFQKFLPKNAMTFAAGILASVKYRPVKNFLIQTFIRTYKVDMSEASALSIEQYVNFNDFFTRELRPGVRPLPDDSQALISPADGVISEFGSIEQKKIIQAKGKKYSLAELVDNEALADELDEGCFATVYLSPKDYHRVHMPMDAVPLSLHYVPGKLFSVNNRTAANLDNLFAINERLVITFENTAGHRFVLVLVGALIVGGMETVLSGPVARSRKPGAIKFCAKPLKKGEELGRFYLGSTAILLCPRGMTKLDDGLAKDMSVKMGQKIGLIQD